jgi:hypothetical protein
MNCKKTYIISKFLHYGSASSRPTSSLRLGNGVESGFIKPSFRAIQTGRLVLGAFCVVLPVGKFVVRLLCEATTWYDFWH